MTENLAVRAEEMACKASRQWLFERHFVIKNKAGKLQLMSPLHLSQRKMLALISLLRKRNEPVRIINAKSRKQGQSTVIEADGLQEVLERGIDMLVIANDKNLSAKLFHIARRFYSHYDRPFRSDIPALKKNPLYRGQGNKREIRFEEGIEGCVEVETANNLTAGTGQTPQYIHASEVSKWDKGAETAISLFQSIGDDPGTTFIIESTFNGYDGLFLPLWETAVNSCRVWFTTDANGDLEAHTEVTDQEKWNHWYPLFIPAYEDPDIARPFPNEQAKDRFLQTLSDYEKTTMAQYGLTAEFVYGRRIILKEKCQGNTNILFQEYPLSWTEAVIASGRCRFDVAKLDAMPTERGEVGGLYFSEKWDKRVNWRRDPGDLLLRFRDVRGGHRYVIGVDVAEGKMDDHGKDPDASVIQVFDCDAGMEQVAVYAGQVSEENLVQPLNMIALYYNTAFVVIESNSTGKHVCIEMGKIYPREMLYHRDDWNPEKSRMSRDIGHRTHVGNRNILIGGLAEAIQENQMVLHDDKTVMECKRFVYKTGGGTAAESGYHDDRVISLALATVGAKVYPSLNRARTSELVQAASMQRRQIEATVNSVSGY